eukprot:2709773-Prymnesium_polylepis.4
MNLSASVESDGPGFRTCLIPMKMCVNMPFGEPIPQSTDEWSNVQMTKRYWPSSRIVGARKISFFESYSASE